MAAQDSRAARFDRWLVVAAMLLPASFLAVAGWQTYLHIEVEAHRELRRGAEVLRQHATNVFETHELVAVSVSEKVRGMGWDEIQASAELTRYLKRVAADYPQVDGIWLADEAGRVRNASVDLPLEGVSVADLDYFGALSLPRAGGALFVGELIPGRVLRAANFPVATRRSRADGGFDGVVVVTVVPSYFTDFWARAAVFGYPNRAVALVRGDRHVLARMPAPPVQQVRLPEDSAFARALAAESAATYRGRSSVDGVERIYAQAKVGRYDAQVVYGISIDDQRAAWRDSMAVYGVVSLFAAAALLFLALRIARTSRREQQAQALAEQTAEKLKEANKELEAFSYSVSHDLRAPLRAIDGFSQALLEDYSDRLDEEGKDALQRVRAAAQRLARLIDDILRLSRLGRAEMRIEEVDLSALAQSVVEELRVGDPARRVEVAIQPGLHVRGDRALLRVVLQNLLANAWKFSSKRADARVEFGTIPQGERVFYVRDNGAGFDPKYKDKLFAPFQRLHSEAEFPGTGIGLATVQRMVVRHGGRVWADSVEGNGASFFFTLRA